MLGWTEFCPQRAFTKHALISSVACPHCGAANPQKATQKERQRVPFTAEPTQNEEIIDLTSLSPSTGSRNILPPVRNAATINQEPQAHHKPQSMQAIRFSPLNRFPSLSQNANDARMAAFDKKEHKDQPHAGWNIHRSHQQEKKEKHSALSPAGPLQLYVFIFKCVKNHDGKIINKWYCSGMSSQITIWLL